MLRFRPAHLLLLLLLLVFAGPRAASADNIPTFQDSNFFVALDYISSPANLVGGGSFFISQCTDCGNPNDAFQIALSFPASPISDQSYSQDFVNTTFAWDPATQGAVTGVGITADIKTSVQLDVNGNLTGFGGFNDVLTAVIYQDGVYYEARNATPFITGAPKYDTLTWDLPPEDFTAGGVPGGTMPNFDGDPMLFGFGYIFGPPAEDGITVVTADYDNLMINVDTAGTGNGNGNGNGNGSSVPEPAMLPMLALGLFGLVGIRLWCRSVE